MEQVVNSRFATAGGRLFSGDGRRAIFCLFGFLVVFKCLSVGFGWAALGPPFLTPLLAICGSTALAGVIAVYTAKTGASRAAKTILVVAMGLILLHRILWLTGTLPFFDSVLLMGREGAYHESALSLLAPVGLILLLVGLFQIGMEIFRARADLARRNVTLASLLEAERSVGELEKNLRCVYDAVRDYVITLRPDGTIIEANRTAAGISLQDAIGTSTFEFVQPQDVDVLRRCIAAVCETKSPQYCEVRGAGDYGSIAHYDCRVGPVLDDRGDVCKVVLVGTDVTEARKSQVALASIVRGTSGTVGDAFFHSLVEHLAIALEMRYALVGELIDPSKDSIETRAVWNGSAHGENFTYELRGTPCQNVIHQRACSYPSGVQALFPQDALLAKMGVQGYLGAPLRNAAGEAIGLLVVMHDAPIKNESLGMSILSVFAARAEAELERRQTDEQRRQFEAQVQYAQKLESLGVLAGGIAHDFNNLLVGVLGFASLAREELAVDDAVQKHLAEIEIAATRAAELTHQMLAYSGRGHFVTERIAVGQLIEEMVQLLHASISKKARLEYDFPEELPEIAADPTQIRQVVMNLITNASDALEDGPGRILLRTSVFETAVPIDADDIAVDPLSPGTYMCLEVTDSGKGMDEEVRKRMFDPFFTTKFTGRGLGLAAVLGIVRSHRGTISVSSRPRRGTTIKIYLPAENAGGNVVERKLNPEPARSNGDRRWNQDDGASATVLFADDESYVRLLARRVLESAGLAVIEARDGEEAVRMFREHADLIDAVVLDLTMPGLSGEEVYREIRQLRADTRVLLSSGYSDDEVVGRLESLGAQGFLRKPYKADALLSKVRGIIPR